MEKTKTKTNMNLNYFPAQEYIMKAGFLAKKGGGKTKIFGRRNWKVRYFLVHGYYLNYYADYDSLPNQNKEIISCG